MEPSVEVRRSVGGEEDAADAVSTDDVGGVVEIQDEVGKLVFDV